MYIGATLCTLMSFLYYVGKPGKKTTEKETVPISSSTLKLKLESNGLDAAGVVDQGTNETASQLIDESETRGYAASIVSFELWEATQTEGAPAARVESDTVDLFTEPSRNSKKIGIVGNAKGVFLEPISAVSITTSYGSIRLGEDLTINVRNFGPAIAIFPEMFWLGGTPESMALKKNKIYSCLHDDGSFAQFLRTEHGDTVKVDGSALPVEISPTVEFWMLVKPPSDPDHIDREGWVFVDGVSIVRTQ